MRAPVSRALMVIVLRSLSGNRREWALAMQAEFELAVADGKPFAFATGCLIAAWGEMLKRAEGRHVVANYTIALGLLIPVAAFQFTLAIGSLSVFADAGAFKGALLHGASNNSMLAWSQHSAVPCLLALWLLLSMAHLRLAWVLIEQDWTRVANVSALNGAVLVTLFLLMTALVLNVTFVALQAGVMAIEVVALVIAARQHAQLFPNACAAITTI